MIAESFSRIDTSSPAQQTLFVLFDNELQAEALLKKLSEISITPEALTLLRIFLNEQPSRTKITRPVQTRHSPQLTRFTTAGGLIGGSLAILIGLLLNYSNFLSLSFIETIFIYFIALGILGTVLGGAIGAIWASYRTPKPQENLIPDHDDNYLVIIKTPLHLIRQCELLAKGLGAKSISG